MNKDDNENDDNDNDDDDEDAPQESMFDKMSKKKKFNLNVVFLNLIFSKNNINYSGIIANRRRV